MGGQRHFDSPVIFMVKDCVVRVWLWCFFGGWGDKKRKKTSLKAAFMGWMDCRCSDRVVIMVLEGRRGDCFDGVCMYRFYGGGGQVVLKGGAG